MGWGKWVRVVVMVVVKMRCSSVVIVRTTYVLEIDDGVAEIPHLYLSSARSRYLAGTHTPFLLSFKNKTSTLGVVRNPQGQKQTR